MNTDRLLETLLRAITVATNDKNLPEISRLSQLAQRVQAIDARLRGLNDELSQIEKSISCGNSPGKTLPQDAPVFPRQEGSVAIEINWRLCNVNRPTIRISERMVSDTLVAFMRELLSAMGVEALQKLSSLRVSRGPLVSQNPQIDYVNNKTGANYVSHRIGDSGYYVLTHSGTPEKITAIKDAWKVLGLTPGALTVSRN